MSHQTHVAKIRPQLLTKKTLSDVTKLLKQSGIIQGGYLVPPADHEYDLQTTDPIELRRSILQMSLKLLDPSLTKKQLQEIKRNIFMFHTSLQFADRPTADKVETEMKNLKKIEKQIRAKLPKVDPLPQIEKLKLRPVKNATDEKKNFLFILFFFNFLTRKVHHFEMEHHTVSACI